MPYTPNTSSYMDIIILLALCAGVGAVPVLLIRQYYAEHKAKYQRRIAATKHFKNL